MPKLFYSKRRPGYNSGTFIAWEDDDVDNTVQYDSLFNTIKGNSTKRKEVYRDKLNGNQ